MPEIWYREILWIISVVIWIYAYYPYIRDVLKGITKPHIYSWIIFVIMDTIAFLIQIGDNAGPWSWGTFITWFMWIIVVFLAFKRWEKQITLSDTIAFSMALITIALYILLENPIYSLYSVLLISLLAAYPTFRKSYNKPFEETLSIYTIAWVRSFLSILATINISLLTIWLPTFVIFINIFFVSMVMLRRKQLWCKVQSKT